MEIEVSTVGGPELKFSTIINPSYLKEPLQKIRNTVGFKNIQYIDMRVENKIYYK